MKKKSNDKTITNPLITKMEMVNFKRIRKMADMITINNGCLLDFGCSDGHAAKVYREKFTGEMYGIDISRESLKKAAKVLDHVRYCNINIEKLPYKSNFFDVIICGEVIEHVFETDNLLSEIYRTLKKNGIFIISTPNLSSFFNRIFILFGLQPLCTDLSVKKSNYGNPFRKNLPSAGHIRNFTFRALKEMLLDNKFIIIKKSGIYIALKGITLLIEKIVYHLLPKTLSNIMIFKCTK